MKNHPPKEHRKGTMMMVCGCAAPMNEEAKAAVVNGAHGNKRTKTKRSL
jgi:hypothetical protein